MTTDVVAKNWGGLLTLGADGRLYSDPNDAPDGGESYFGFTPTIYADPAAEQGTGSGNSEANAMLLSEALSIAAADDVIGVLPGTAVGTDTNTKLVPAFLTANSGTSGHPIKVVAKYPWNDDANKTILETDAPTSGDGCPTLGSHQRNYVEWYGFYIDEANAHNQGDSGVAMFSECTGVKVMYCRIIADPASLPDDNHTGAYFNETSDCALQYNTISGFEGGGSSNYAGIMEYGAANATINNNEIYDCNTGHYIKGHPATLWNYGSRAYNFVHDVLVGYRMQHTSPTNFTIVEHNLVIDFQDAAIAYATGADPSQTRNIIVRRNTTTGQAHGLAVAAITGDGCQMVDNLVALYAPNTNQNYIDGGEYTDNDFDAITYNGFWGSTNGTPWSWNSADQATVGAFQAAATNAANNQVLANDPLANRGSDNYSVTGAATTASSTGGPIGADFSLVGPDA